jgi:hypothetical protein
MLAGLAVLVRDRNPRFLIGLVALPVVYLSAGAVWHRDPLWFWHFPASFAHLAQTGVFGGAEEEVRRTSVTDLALAVGTVTPALGLALIPGGRAPGWVSVGQSCTALFIIAIAVLPRFGVAMGYSQRYFLQILPLASLLAAHRLERAGPLMVAGFAAVTVCLGPMFLSPSAARTGSFCIVALAATVAFLTLAWRRCSRLAAVGLGAFAFAWPFSGLPLDAFQTPSHRVTTEAVEWLRAHPDERASSAVVVTNLKLLDASLAHTGVLPPVEVQCLIQTDNEYELRTLTDAANGQQARIFALAAWRFYGRGVLAREFVAHPGPPGALVVLQRDERSGALDPDSLAAHGATVLLRTETLSILRLP